MDDPRIEAENLKQARGEYDDPQKLYESWRQVKQDEAALYPDDLGEIYGVGEFDIPEPTADDAMAEPDQLQRALIAYRIIQLDNIRKAAKEQNGFFFDAMKRNGVL